MALKTTGFFYVDSDISALLASKSNIIKVLEKNAIPLPYYSNYVVWNIKLDSKLVEKEG